MGDTALTAGRIVTQSFTRPADTTVYAAGDIVGPAVAAIMQLGGLVQSPKGPPFGILQSLTIISSQNGAPKPDLQLWLFDAVIAAVADNAPFAPTDAELKGLLQVIALPVGAWLTGNSGVAGAGNACCNVQGLQLPLRCDSPTNNVYGVLVIQNAYTPIASEEFTLRLGIVD